MKRVMTALAVALCLFSAPPAAFAACPGSCGDDKTERVVFVSNAEVTAQSLGGISGGDALCQSWAEAAGLEGNYLAWLGDNTTDPATRFEKSTVPYVMVNGTQIADDWTDLTDGTLDSLFRVTQTNGTNDGFVIANVDTDGTVFSPNATQHCNNFTSSAGGAIMQIGRNQFTNANWTRFNNTACTTTMPLYCFEQQTPCSNPAGHAGEIIFNRDYRAMEYCNGTGWVSMGKEASVLHGQKTTSDKQMLGWYRMDATSGTEETDYSPVGNTGNYGSLDPATQSEPGISGTAINFANNTNALLSVTNPIYNDLDTVTISAWVKADGTYDGVMGIVGIGNLFKLRSGFNNDIIQFTLNSWTGSGTWSVSPARLTADTWRHIVVTYSYNDPVGTAPKIYVDGVLQGGGYNVTPTGTFTPDNGAPVQIGKRNDSSGGNFHGLIDDVRIYNYILDADEIAELYAASDMAYQPNAVAFDGTNDYMDVNADLPGASDSKQWTGSFWIKSNESSRLHTIHEGVNFSSAIRWDQSSSSSMVFLGKNPSGTTVLDITTDPLTGTDWHHVMFSFDMSNPANSHIYIDDVDAIDTQWQFTNDIIDFTAGDFAIGAGNTGLSKGNFDMADVWMDFGTYIDLSVEANRRKFISASGQAVYLGATGNLPTGETPDIFLSGDTATWHTNKGTGGGFTENGALTDAATEPPGGASIIPRYCSNPVQPAGTLIFNSSENVMQYCDGYRHIPLSAPGLGAGGCVSPAGLAGEMVFNTSVNSLQYCDGSGWVGVGPYQETATSCTSLSAWTVQSAAEANGWQSVTYGNGLFVAVSNSGTNRVMTSPDGITWTPRTAAAANIWRSVTYGNGLFVAVSNTGTNRVMTSPDGITWTPRTAAAANSWLSVTYGNGLFVAVSSDGTNRVMTSPDGITWTPRTAAAANSWVSVTYGNGLFVAVSNGGTNRVMTSPDGITWTPRTAAEANTWSSITYGNGLFVTVAQSGTNRVMTSPDGITWTPRMATEANTWLSVTYGNGLFVALSVTGTNRVMTSPDGTIWTAQTAAEANSWASAVFGNNMFVSVAYNGTNRVMTASCN